VAWPRGGPRADRARSRHRGRPARQRHRSRGPLPGRRGHLGAARAQAPLRERLRARQAPAAAGRPARRCLHRSPGLDPVAAGHTGRGRPRDGGRGASRPLALLRPRAAGGLRGAGAAALRAVPLRDVRGQPPAPALGRPRGRRARGDLRGPPADEGAMRPAAIAWDRAATVQAAARGWRSAGAIDSPTLARIRETFPDPCLTPTPVWRVLTGGIVAAIVLCALAALVLSFWRSSTLLQVALLAFGVAGLAVADVLEGRPRWARRGVAGALSGLGLALLLLGVTLLAGETLRLRDDDIVDTVLVCGLAAWRWGSPLFTGLAGGALLVGLARLPHPRLLWLAAGAGLVVAAAPCLDSARLAAPRCSPRRASWRCTSRPTSTRSTRACSSTSAGSPRPAPSRRAAAASRRPWPPR